MSKSLLAALVLLLPVFAWAQTPDTTSAPAQSVPAMVIPQSTVPVIAQSGDAPKVTPPEPTTFDIGDEPETEFQQFVGGTVGRKLPIFGRELFRHSPTTFAPVDRIPVTADYVIGPGDELLLRAWGAVDMDLRMTVDRNGLVHVPKVGDLNVSGLRYEQLPGFMKTSIGKVFRNFDLTVTLGELRSLQIFVVGHARRPGTYTVSSLSTLVNALFASGGPSSAGSMRRIQLRRLGSPAVEFDLYDLLIRGDKSHDQRLLPGDVIYIPPVGPQIAVAGSVNRSAIYELLHETTLSEALEIAGGLTTLASSETVSVERIESHSVRQVLSVALDSDGRSFQLRDGDLVQIGRISGRFDNAVTLRGNVSHSGRYPFKPGMRISDLIPDRKFLITPEFWEHQNKLGTPVTGARVSDDMRSPDVEINWNYAVLQRLGNDLSAELVPFDLGKALEQPNSADNLMLQPGDVITVFSQREVEVPASRKSRYVRIEGEVAAPGIYRAQPGETLRDLVRRAGGLTQNAFLYGAQFTREAVRAEQQERYQKYLNELEQQLRANATQVRDGDSAAAQQREELDRQTKLLAEMKKIQPTGRIVMGLKPQDASADALPAVELEDGDRLMVPAKASTVNVLGAVYNENAYLYADGKKLDWYLGRAGGARREADRGRAFVIRADGGVVNRNHRIAGDPGFGKVFPGDTIVMPVQLQRGSFMRGLHDWSQVISQFALGAAAVRVLER